MLFDHYYDDPELDREEAEEGNSHQDYEPNLPKPDFPVLTDCPYCGSRRMDECGCFD